MHRSAILLLCAFGAVACSEPTSSTDRLASLAAQADASKLLNPAATASPDSVEITIINDTPDWQIGPLNALARYKDQAFWLAAFGVLDRHQVQIQRGTGTIAPGSRLTVTLSATPGSLRGKRGWINAAATTQTEVDGHAVPAAPLKCGPKSPVAGAPHVYRIEFQVTAGHGSAVRCR